MEYIAGEARRELERRRGGVPARGRAGGCDEGEDARMSAMGVGGAGVDPLTAAGGNREFVLCLTAVMLREGAIGLEDALGRIKNVIRMYSGADAGALWRASELVGRWALGDWEPEGLLMAVACLDPGRWTTILEVVEGAAGMLLRGEPLDVVRGACAWWVARLSPGEVGDQEAVRMLDDIRALEVEGEGVSRAGFFDSLVEALR